MGCHGTGEQWNERSFTRRI
ncbi:MAG: hypothetical protein ACE5HI_08090 [bacterium]